MRDFKFESIRTKCYSDVIKVNNSKKKLDSIFLSHCFSNLYILHKFHLNEIHFFIQIHFFKDQ